LERWWVGVVMAVVAFILEKVAMRSVRKESSPDATSVTARGGEVDL
jgi:hypothetical protein